MEENINETVIMPDETVSSIEQCMDDLLNTRDIGVYLDSLITMKSKYLLIMSVQDTPGILMPNDIFDKLLKLGFSNFIREHLRTYIGVIDRGKVLSDFHNEKETMPIEYSTDVDDIHISVKSEAYKKGSAEISINGENYSLNSRGINIVVFDVERKKVVDSSTYDAWLPKAPFYHKNLEFDDSYFNKHMFVPAKYQNEWRDPFRKKYFSNRKLNIKEVSNGIILPMKKIKGKRCGGVCDENYKFISGFYNFSHDCEQKNDRCVSSSYEPDDKNIKYVDETVLYGGIYYDHPGHLIIETLANWLWYLVQNEDKELKIAVIIYKWLDNISFFMESMEAFGLPRDKIMVISAPTKFKKVLIPDFSSLMYLYATPYEFTKEWALFFQHIRDNISPGKYKKIYLSKTKTSHGNIVGEEFFIDFYKKHGFEILDPEDYTIKEKAELMLGADEVVTVIGTNDLFTVFCKPSTTVTLLTRIDNSTYGASAMSMIGEATGCKNIYVINVAAGFLYKQFTMGLVPLYVTNEFKEYVRTVFNEEIDIDPEESLKNILIDYMKYIPEYYSIPKYFNCIKNQKMITVLQNISELFLGKDFDTSKLDLSTNESHLQDQVKELNTKNDLLVSQVNELSEENKKLKSAKGSTTINFENTSSSDSNYLINSSDTGVNSELSKELSRLKNENEALKQKVAELENANQTLISANMHLTETVVALSSLIKNNNNIGE